MTGLPRRLYVHRRVVAWGDCDPARIVYTPKFLDYALEAAEALFARLVGVDWYRLNLERGQGQPLVHADLDFVSAARPGDRLLLAVRIAALSRATLTYRVEARLAKGGRCFDATLVSVLIDTRRFKSISWPKDYRRRLAAYAALSQRKPRR
ncbi:MAG: acyl-CoA thioesterase [Alphaproteobacteria bacterium]|nr:acyl-CoA thioesterase [Alphaproteobacteria bacterium]